MTDVLASDEPARLADGFAPVDDEAWADAVRSATRGRGPEALVRTTLDGLAVEALYVGPTDDAGLPGIPPHVRGRTGARPTWTVHAAVDHPDPTVAAERLRVDVDGGAEGAVVAAHVPTGVFGDVLGPVGDRLSALVLRPRRDAPQAARELVRLLGDDVEVGLGLDPVGVLAATGWSAQDPDEAVRAGAAFAAEVADRPGARAFVLDATPWSSAGGSDAEVLGLLTAQVVHVLRGLLDAGVDADAAMAQIQVVLPVDADQFAGLCALRALRRLVDRVADLAGASDGHRAVRTDLTMAPRTVTRRDPWVNLLRGTVVAFVAGVGGADGALVLPYDVAGDPSPLGRRLARTTQLVLREESRLARVDDPAGGSWYVEERTERLAEAAWEVVREVDRRGGLVAALTSGWIADRLADTRRRRDELVATRRLPLTGVSEFPDLDEDGLPDPAVDVVDRRDLVGAEVAEAPPGDAVIVDALPVARFADAFEALRDASDAHLAATGERPTVFLAALGPLAEHTARVEFARNLFAAGGIAAVVGDGATGAAEAAEAFTASGARLACVCGTDERYAELAAPVVEALRAAGAARVHLAGRTPDGARADDDVHVGCDVVAVLRRAHTALGIDVPATEKVRR